MKTRTLIVVLALACLSGYVATGWSPSVPAPARTFVEPSPVATTETAALAGVWEGFGPDHLPMRLVVEDVHENWATILYSWGDQPEGMFQRGWVRVRARVLPNGKLFWRHPGEFTFQLSEDWTTLVGKREQGGRTATSLMRRVPSDVALKTLVADKTE